MDRDSGCSSASREPLPLPTPQDVMAIFALLTPLEQRDVRHMMSEVIPPVTPWRLETNPSDTVREARKKIAYGEHLHDLARASISMQLISMEPSLAKSPEGRKLQRLHQMQQQQQLSRSKHQDPCQRGRPGVGIRSGTFQLRGSGASLGFVHDGATTRPIAYRGNMQSSLVPHAERRR